ncbi:PcfJ domain-containing protein [Exercitatus varius]|uniref:PcfJ domain-containing protein n=1 Tax=Exercitatus varius TaxID=67857 RepID=UPI00294AFE70|nr:PcfJ domain-containing protein [Exercitatus varius]MDG2961724.1 PcfJ domain-containing protein [Exercitatus varius]
MTTPSKVLFGSPEMTEYYRKGSRFGIMTRKSHWRWLKKQSSQFIVNWHEQELDLFINLERAIPNIPVCLGKTILYFNDFFRQFHPHQNRVLQLFAQYAIDYKKTHGIRQLRHYLKNKVENELYDLYDYWQHGQYQGIPKIWERLLERSQQWHQWHRELLIQQQLRKDKAFQAQLNATWESPVQTHHIGNITFNALNTGLALFDEGQRMHHCIFSYLQRCIDKKYLAFSVVEACQDDSKQPRYSYSTLGLKRVKSVTLVETDCIFT